MGEIANHKLDLDIAMAVTEKESNELLLVQEAIKRIDEGVFGECVDCENQIDLDRLLANPVASRCFNCESHQEDSRGGKDSTPTL